MGDFEKLFSDIYGRDEYKDLQEKLEFDFSNFSRNIITVISYHQNIGKTA